MNKEEFIKSINGELYYKYDYAYWLYEQLEIKDKEIERLKEDIETRKKEIDFWRIQFSNKEEIINKAIEYIKTYKESFKNYIASDLEFNVYELLDILKGVDKE